MFSTFRDWILAVLVVMALGTGIVYSKDLSGQLHGNATSATALANNPSDCQPDKYAVGIDSQANLNCAKITDNALSSNIPRLNGLENIFLGEVSASQFIGNLSGNVTGNLFGNADTATKLLADPLDCAPGAYANAISAFGNLSCSFNGSSLQNISASNITSGTLSDDRLSSNVALLNRNNQTFTGSNTFNSSLAVNGIATFNNTVNVNGGGLNVNNGNNANFTGSANVDGNFTVQNNTTLGSDYDNNSVTVDARLFGPSGHQLTVGHYATSGNTDNGLRVWGFTNLEGGLQVGANWNHNDFSVYGTSTFNGDAIFNGNLFGAFGTNPLTVGTSGNSVGLTAYGQTDLRNGNVDIFDGNLKLHDNNIRQVHNIGTSGNRVNKLWVTNVDASNNITAFSFNAGAGNFNGNLTGNADTATALASDPIDCTVADTYATAIDSFGNLTCSGLPGNVAYTDAANVFTANQTIQVDSNNAFLVENSSATPVLTVDTNGSVVTVNDGSGLYVANGNVTIDGAGGGLVITQGNEILSAGGLDAAGNISSTAGFLGDLTGNVTGNASTATAFDHSPTGCSANTFATSIDSGGNLGCSSITAADLPGNVAYTDAANVFTADQTIQETSATAFNVLKSGNPIFNVDTSANQVNIGSIADGVGLYVANGDITVDNGNGIVTSSGNIIAGAGGGFIGDGSQLTGLKSSQMTFDGSIDMNGHSITNANNISFSGQLNGNSGTLVNAVVDSTVSGDGQNFTNLQGGNVVGAVGTANALAANPTDCAAGQYANAIAANGNLTCAQVAASEISGLGTMAVQNASSVNITGGLVDSVAITNSSFSGTTLTLSGAAIFNGTTTFNNTVTATSLVDLTGASSVKLPTTAVAITDGVTACSQQARVLFTTASNHVFVCDGTVWQQLD